MPVPMFNEKAECRLVEGLSTTGKLSPDGIKKALQAIRRFVRLSEAMRVEELDFVATAAVREASDGDDFVATLENEFDIDVSVISGAEEAELAALGLVVGVPNANGVLCDLGGGSLDLVSLEHGEFSDFGSLSLGHLRLREMSGNDIDIAQKIIVEQLHGLSWLTSAKGKNLYLTGGIMRAIARIFIDQTSYPLHVVDNFTIRSDDAYDLCRVLTGLSAGTIKRMSVAPSRAKSMPYATAVLMHLIDVIKPEQVIFSGFGMREGQMLKHLPENIRHQDPLVAGAATYSERIGRFAMNGREVANWLKPIFPELNAEDERRIVVSCLLSDIGWHEHPDYRAEHAFYRTLRIPFAGLSHPDRVFIAAAVYVRYNGDPGAKVVNKVRGLLASEQLAKVDGIGRAIRLAHTLSGSAPGLLALTSMERKGNKLVLHLPGDAQAFKSETVDRRFRGLCKSLDLSGTISRT